jgi:hypothetical protein
VTSPFSPPAGPGRQNPDLRPTMGVSLSGGGHRATLFSLGALLAVSECAGTFRVAWVSSVSGGSIANGVLLRAGGLGTPSSDQLAGVVRERLRRLDRRFAPFNTVRSVAALAAWLAVVVGVLALLVWTRPWGGLRLLLLVAALLLLSLIVRQRGRILEWALDDMWLRDRGVPTTVLGWDADAERDAALDDGPEIPIFCSTDLLSLGPQFIGKSFLVSDDQLWTLRRISLIRALRTSASFPGLLPPVWTRLRSLAGDPATHLNRRRSRSTGAERARPPRWGLLTDGGVYNNLGTHWGTRGRLSDHDGRVLPRRLRQPVDQHLVVDAGRDESRASPITFAIPFIGALRSLLQVPRASYSAALRAHRSEIADTTWLTRSGRREHARVVRITDRLGWGTSPSPEATELSVNAWQIICWTSQGARTHMFHVRRDKALRVLAHGYAMTIDRLASMGVPAEDLGRHWHTWLGAAVTEGLPALAWQESVLDHASWAQLPRRERERRPVAGS